MADHGEPNRQGPILMLVGLAIAAFLCAVAAVGQADSPGDGPGPARLRQHLPVPGATPSRSPRASPSRSPNRSPSRTPAPTHRPSRSTAAAPAQLPGGGVKVFARHRFLVAYYGTAQTGALGVLGRTPPEEMQRRVWHAAQPFRRGQDRIQVVYELIVTLADRSPGRDGDYSHDIPRTLVERYLRVAHRHDALLLLDLQPGRSRFPAVARRWAWALRDPWVGLALDPEWRMGPHQRPAHVIGSVAAREVDQTSAWLAGLTRHHHLPQKLFVLHEFRPAMIRDIGLVRPHAELAMVQHADGFGTRRQKLASYHAVARPQQFRMGFKLFYRVDVRRFTAAGVRAIRPPVRFVSFQ